VNSDLPRWLIVAGGLFTGLFGLWMVASVVMDYDEQPEHSGPLGVLSASDSSPVLEGK
tara:strand:- start:972 stop:1145 length:174 start_codon:yes stop_codon:yes gene_type:complete